MWANWIWNQFREEQGSKAAIWVKSGHISPPNQNYIIIIIIIQNNTYLNFFCIDFGVKYDFDIFLTEYHFINIFLLCFLFVLVSYA